ncbi:MAG: hypothetical protein ABWJ97_06500, partial [Thermoproteus sp.]
SGSLSLSSGRWYATVSTAPATLVTIFPATLPAGTYAYTGPSSITVYDSAGNTIASCSGSPCSFSISYTAFYYVAFTYSFSTARSYILNASLTYTPPPQIQMPPSYPPYGCNNTLAVIANRVPWQYSDTQRSVVNGILQNFPALLNYWQYPAPTQYTINASGAYYVISPNVWGLLPSGTAFYQGWTVSQPVTLTKLGLRDAYPFSPLSGGTCSARLVLNSSANWYVTAVNPPAAGITVVRSDGSTISLWANASNGVPIEVSGPPPTTATPLNSTVSLIISSVPFYVTTWSAPGSTINTAYDPFPNTVVYMQNVRWPGQIGLSITNLNPGTYAVVISSPNSPTAQISGAVFSILPGGQSQSVILNVPSAGMYTISIYPLWSATPTQYATAALTPGQTYSLANLVAKVVTLWGGGATPASPPPVPPPPITMASLNYQQQLIMMAAVGAVVIMLSAKWKEPRAVLVAAGAAMTALGVSLGATVILGFGILLIAAGFGYAILRR